MKQLTFILVIFILLLQVGCSSEEATEYERVNSEFTDNLGGAVSAQQWWRTAVALRINVTTDEPVMLMLLSQLNGPIILYDCKVLESSGTVTMTAPQGQGNTFSLSYLYKNQLMTQELVLRGTPEEVINLNLVGNRNANGQ